MILILRNKKFNQTINQKKIYQCEKKEKNNNKYILYPSLYNNFNLTILKYYPIKSIIMIVKIPHVTF